MGFLRLATLFAFSKGASHSTDSGTQIFLHSLLCYSRPDRAVSNFGPRQHCCVSHADCNATEAADAGQLWFSAMGVFTIPIREPYLFPLCVYVYGRSWRQNTAWVMTTFCSRSKMMKYQMVLWYVHTQTRCQHHEFVCIACSRLHVVWRRRTWCPLFLYP